MMKKLIYTTHRILGTLLSVLFLMWFLSGFVMLYHGFPYISLQERYNQMTDINTYSTINYTDSLIACSLNKNELATLQVNSYFGNTRLIETFADSQQQQIITSEGAKSITPPTFAQIHHMAKKWSKTKITRVDTLYHLEQWIPWANYYKDMPIYKFYFEDTKQLYVSSLTGEPLQLSNQSQRFWAWVGAIPHWIYFTQLRQHASTWRSVVGIIAGIGCIMTLSGIIIGIRSYIKTPRRKRIIRSPYKKQAYKWHHITGLIFGMFVFTFIFSGMMSVTNVPQLLVKVHRPELASNIYRTTPLKNTPHIASYKQILQKYPNQVKEIKWTNLANIPLYHTIIGDSLIIFDASTPNIQPLKLTEQHLHSLMDTYNNIDYRIDTLSRYDNYYGRIGREDQYPLPVYKISVNDADQSTYYIQPHTGNIHYYNANTKARHWSYQVLHRFALAYFIQHNTPRLILMWVVLIGGTIISATGVWLSMAYITRQIKKRRK